VAARGARAAAAITGKIAKVTIKLGPTQLTEADREITHAHILRTKD